MPSSDVKRLISAFLLSLLAGCATAPGTAERLETARQAASRGGMSGALIHTSLFDLAAYHRPGDKAELAIIYIEGDGLGYISKSRPSSDPTPVDPVMLKLATSDPRKGVAYLARPCQFTGGDKARNCQNDLWTLGRFSEDVVTSTNEAIDQLMAQSGSHRLALVGYSGGGDIAMLVAARRRDIDWVMTVASPLDIDAFTQHHKVAAMVGSLNPASYADKLSTVPQLHYVGTDDEIVPASILRSYLAALPHEDCAKLVEVNDTNHHDGWLSLWPRLSSTVPSCTK